jgi:hypothetical protein
MGICLLKIVFSKQEINYSKSVIILITLLITLQIRHAEIPFLSVFADRADGSNPTATVIRKRVHTLVWTLFLLIGPSKKRIYDLCITKKESRQETITKLPFIS